MTNRQERYLQNYQLAIADAVGIDMTEVFALVRCKPKKYFDFVERGGIERPYPYSHRHPTGHEEAVMNQGDGHTKIAGLFFGVHVPLLYHDYGSPFGDRRMLVDAFKMLNPEENNFYYSDFYCLDTKPWVKKHDVTIIVAKKKSAINWTLAVEFNLILLPIDDKTINPWMAYNAETTRMKLICPTNRQRLEFVITDEVNLEEMGAEFDDIRALGTMERSTGCPINLKCVVCNVKPSDEEMEDKIKV